MDARKLPFVESGCTSTAKRCRYGYDQLCRHRNHDQEDRHSPMTNGPHFTLSVLGVPDTDILQALFVHITKHLPCDTPTLVKHLTCSSKVVCLVSCNTPIRVHDIIAGLQSSLSKSELPRIGVTGDLSQDFEVGSESSRIQVWYDDISRDEREGPVELNLISEV
jgi:hypothetical protein